MKNRFLKIFTTLFILFIAINNVSASEIVAADEVLTDEGVYDSLRLVAGSKVTTKSVIDGISFAAGNEVNIYGNASYGFYAGNNVNVNGTIEKDVFVAGNNINVLSDAVIKRDAYIAGNNIIIKTNIGRDLRVGGMSVDISGITINGDVIIDAEEIILDENTIVTGKLSYIEDARIKGLDVASLGSVEKRISPDVTVKIDVRDSIYSLLISIIASFITGLVLFYIIPNTKEKLEEVKTDFSTVLKTLCIGLLVLLATPIACILALVTGVLTPLSIITIVVYFISIYLSKILVSYIIGNIITTKVFKNNNYYLALAMGIVLFKFLNLIPVLGGYITFITLIYGLGLIYNYIINKK